MAAVTVIQPGPRRNSPSLPLLVLGLPRAGRPARGEGQCQLIRPLQVVPGGLRGQRGFVKISTGPSLPWQQAPPLRQGPWDGPPLPWVLTSPPLSPGLAWPPRLASGRQSPRSAVPKPRCTKESRELAECRFPGRGPEVWNLWVGVGPRNGNLHPGRGGGALGTVEAPQQQGEPGVHSSPSWAGGLGLIAEPLSSTMERKPQHCPPPQANTQVHGGYTRDTVAPRGRLLALLHASRDRQLPPSLPGSDR